MAALKRVTYSSRQSNDFELALLPKLSHPNIIKVYDYREVQEGEGNHGFDLLLEYAENGTVFSIQATSPVTSGLDFIMN